MTQIRSLAQPVTRRPGELGVHSLDLFNFSVPDVAAAEKFYSSFGLDVREEGGKLNIYTQGHPHRWGSVVEGPRKKLHFISFGAFEDDFARFRARLQSMRIDLLDPPAGFEFERPVVSGSRRHAARDPGRREVVPQREVAGEQPAWSRGQGQRAEPEQGPFRATATLGAHPGVYA